MSKWRRNRSLTQRWNRNYLVNKYGCVCGICEKPIKTMKEITIDHIIPRSRGGADHIDNYQLAHFTCNQDKDSMLPIEFNKFQERVLSE